MKSKVIELASHFIRLQSLLDTETIKDSGHLRDSEVILAVKAQTKTKLQVNTVYLADMIQWLCLFYTYIALQFRHSHAQLRSAALSSFNAQFTGSILPITVA